MGIYLKKVRSSPRTPNGYRLATYQEIDKNLKEISSRRVINDSENCRVLDGILRATGEVKISWNAESEEERPKHMLLIRQSHSPGLSGEGSVLLRRDLYDGVAIDDKRRENALYLACCSGDIEVIYWLRHSSTDQSGLIKCFDKIDALELCGSDFSIICKMLLHETLDIGEDELRKSLDYAWRGEAEPNAESKLRKSSDYVRRVQTDAESEFRKSLDYAISVVEIILEACPDRLKMGFVNEQIQRMFESSNTEARHIGILAKLLWMSAYSLENCIDSIRGRFQTLLTEACHRGYVSLVAGLLRLRHLFRGEIKDEVDHESKTLLHYAAEWEQTDHADEVFWELFEQLSRTPDGYKDKLDPNGRSVLHFASLGGRAEICKGLIFDCKWEAKCKDKWNQNILHYAARGKNGSNIVDALDGKDKELTKHLVSLKNNRGETPLHAVAIYGNLNMFHSLCSLVHKPDLNETDNAGRTPLHIAASEGYHDLVIDFLKNGSDPLEERDMSGRTALHFAVTNTKGKDTAMALAKTLLDYCKSKEKKALLLWVSASGIGTAEETRGIDPDLKKYLLDQRNKTKDIKLLVEAAKAGKARLAWEFLVRGGNTSEITEMPQTIRKQIETYMEQGMERPTLVDTLGRDALAECIAEHFLNSHIKSPINVSISGGSGMGKTSLMQQIKAYLQITSAQLSIPYLWKYEELSGKKEISLSKTGKTMLREIQKGVMNLTDTKKDIGYGSSEEKPLVQFLSKYRPEYEAVYKSLACMDFAQLLDKKEENSGYRFQGQSLGEAPRILTVDYNAGMYRGNYEAWAGLALEITQAIEDSMTWAQRLSTRWRNATRKHNISFLLKFILPGFLLTFIACWVAWAAWMLLDRTGKEDLKDLKYGSIPATIIAIVWTVLNSVTSIFKSVSSEMSDYFKVSDYSEQLSYQQNVISDIKFLQKEIGKKPLFFFSFIAGEKCKNWFGLWQNNIENTSVPKYGSAPDAKLQIIAFVDDLDHCENEAVLKVLWSINLVFRTCDINFILAVDKTTIQTAFSNSTESQGEDSADDFISKTIQLPVNLPDPEDNEWKVFIEEQLGLEYGAEKDEIEICNHLENTAFSSAKDKEPCADSRQKHADGREMFGCEGCIPYSHRQLVQPNGKSQDIEAGNNHSENGISSFFKKILSWLQRFLCILYIVACNVRTETATTKTVELYCDETDLWKSNELSTRMLEVRGSLMLSYSEEEIQTFDKLRHFAAGRKKFPREWKCYIKYHKFAKNVILKKARKLKIVFHHAWQAEFVSWIFVCLHCKTEMNILIKQWHKLIPIKGGECSPKITSLKEVVATYIAQRWPEHDEKEWIKLTEALNKIQGNPKNWAQEFEIKCRRMEEEIEFKYKTTQSKIDAEEEQREHWGDLYKCLEVQDVTLTNLQIFQQFRFHCDARNLEIPFDEKQVPK